MTDKDAARAYIISELLKQMETEMSVTAEQKNRGLTVSGHCSEAFLPFVAGALLENATRDGDSGQRMLSVVAFAVGWGANTVKGSRGDMDRLISVCKEIIAEAEIEKKVAER